MIIHVTENRKSPICCDRLIKLWPCVHSHSAYSQKSHKPWNWTFWFQVWYLSMSMHFLCLFHVVNISSLYLAGPHGCRAQLLSSEAKENVKPHNKQPNSAALPLAVRRCHSHSSALPRLHASPIPKLPAAPGQSAGNHSGQTIRTKFALNADKKSFCTLGTAGWLFIFRWDILIWTNSIFFSPFVSNVAFQGILCRRY